LNTRPVSAKIDALYRQPPELPADCETTDMARLRRESHAPMLGNELSTRPAELDCRMEFACETCAYFGTDTQFLPILVRQRDHARDHGQTDRAALFDRLIQRTGRQTT
jgi:integrase/recombinase XerD